MKLFLLFYFALRLIWIPDIPFGNDDAQLFLRAMADAEAGKFTSFGLLGSRGMEYGPFAIWCYRALLFVTRDIYFLAAIRIFLVAAITVASLVLVAKRLSFLNNEWLWIALASPYLLTYGRDLWDNSLVIPLSGIVFASYLYFLEKRKGWALVIACVAISCGVLTHLVFLPIAAAVTLHLFMFSGAWTRAKGGWTAVAFLTATLVASPYVLHVLKTVPQMQSGGVPYDLGHLLTPILGARFYTGLGMEHFIGDLWYHPAGAIMNALWMALLAPTAIGYGLCWYGIYLSFRDVKSTWRSRPPVSDMRFHFSLISLLALGFQIAMSFKFRLIPIPNFHSALWLVYYYFVWRSLDLLSARPVFRKVAFSYGALLIIACVGYLGIIHANGGSRWHHYGPSLGNFRAVARELNRYGETPYRNEVPLLNQLPYILPALRKLEVTSEKPIQPNGELVLQYLEPDNLRNARLLLSDIIRHPPSNP